MWCLILPPWLCCVVGDKLHPLLLSLVKQNAEIKQQVMYNTQLLQDLNRRHRGLDREKVGQLPFQLPLKTYDAVLDVEQKLKSKDHYSQLVSFPKVIHFYYVEN